MVSILCSKKTIMQKTKVAIIGSGNIGTDLMIKVIRLSKNLEMSAMVGIDPNSDGLARAKRMGFATTAKGIKGLVDMPEWKDIKIIFDATSAKACLLYTSPSPRDATLSRMPSSA